MVAPPQFGFAQEVIASAPPSYAELNPTPQVGAKFASPSNYLCLILEVKNCNSSSNSVISAVVSVSYGVVTWRLRFSASTWKVVAHIL